MKKKRLKNTFWSANSRDTLFLYLLVSKAGLSIQVHNNCYICCDGTGGDCQTLPGICWKSSGKGRLRHLIFLFKICCDESIVLWHVKIGDDVWKKSIVPLLRLWDLLTSGMGVRINGQEQPEEEEKKRFKTKINKQKNYYCLTCNSWTCFWESFCNRGPVCQHCYLRGMLNKFLKIPRGIWRVYRLRQKAGSCQPQSIFSQLFYNFFLYNLTKGY